MFVQVMNLVTQIKENVMINVKENPILDNLSIILRSLIELLVGIQVENQYSQEEMQSIIQTGIKTTIELIDQELP